MIVYFRSAQILHNINSEKYDLRDGYFSYDNKTGFVSEYEKVEFCRITKDLSDYYHKQDDKYGRNLGRFFDRIDNNLTFCALVATYSNKLVVKMYDKFDPYEMDEKELNLNLNENKII